MCIGVDPQKSSILLAILEKDNVGERTDSPCPEKDVRTREQILEDSVKELELMMAEARVNASPPG